MMEYSDGVTVEKAERQDVEPILSNLCWGDRIEAEAHGVTTDRMFYESFDQSLEAYTIKINGNPVSMFGITKPELLSTSAMFWILSAEEVFKVSKKLLRHSREYIDKFLEEHDELYNFIHGENKKALRWAQFLGAMCYVIPEVGTNRENFYKFVFKKNMPAIKHISEYIKSLDPRDKIDAFEQALLKHPNAILADDEKAPPLVHDFTNGIYTRTIKIPKGMILTGKIHKHDHPNFLMQGKVEVYTEEDGLQLLEAPLVMMSKAGTKRVVYTLEDTVWSTVHLNPTNTRDLKELEDMIIAKTYDDVDYLREVI